MQTTLLVARLVLATIFLLAGVTKLVDRKGSSKALSDFGLPQVLAGPLSRLLAVGETLVAVAFVPVSLAWYGACGALALLTIFLIGIGVTLARGLKPDCRCFGQLYSTPIGWPTLFRNGVLAAPAAWLVSRGRLQMGPPLWAHLSTAGGNERRMFVVAACLICWLFFHALRRSDNTESESVNIDSQLPWESEPVGEAPQRNAPLRSDSSGVGRPSAPAPIVPSAGFAAGSIASTGIALPIGTPAPEFDLPGITGQRSSLRSLRAPGKTIVLVFSSPYCEPCRALLPNINRWMQEHDESLNIVVVSRGTAKENLAKLKDVEVSRVMLQQDFEVAEAYGCTSTPAAVLVGADGLIRSDLAEGGMAIKRLISSSVRPPRAEN